MLTAVIVEDNMEEAELLKIPLLELQPEAEAIIFQSGEEAFDFIKDETKKADVFFLDRELPGMNGFELAQQIRAEDRYGVTPIVFVTGYDMDKLYAYEQYSCYHYILKPFSGELVKEKIHKLLEVLSKDNPAPLNQVICLNTGKGDVFVLTNDIFFIEKNMRGCLVFTADKTFEVTQTGLEKIIDEINEKYFVRCHKSFAVNLKNILNMNKSGRDLWSVEFKKEVEGECLVSKNYYKNTMELYREYLETADRRTEGG